MLAPQRYSVSRPPEILSGAAGQAWEQAALPLLARREGVSLLFNPANMAPLGGPGNVVVIHDAAAIREPEWYSPAYARWQKLMLPRIAAGAKLVITPSEFSRTEIVELLGVEPGKVLVVPGGVDERFSPKVDAEPVASVLGLERPYVLTVASRTSRKNLAVLSAAARRLNEEGYELVAAGGERPELNDQHPSAAGVRSLGVVPEALLPGLYAGASAFVLPSLHEGFGLTALEAMKSGVPVVVGRSGALPETCGEAATYVDPEDEGAITTAILDNVGSERPSEACIRQASLFSWERSAQEVDRAVAAVLGE